MTATSARPGEILHSLLELAAVLAVSILAGMLIGFLQHYVSFGVWGYGFGKGAFWLARHEGAGAGAVFGIPTGLLAYYGILKRRVTGRQVAIIGLGSLVGGCAVGAAIFWPSAFVTPVLTILLAWQVRVSPRPLSRTSVTPQKRVWLPRNEEAPGGFGPAGRTRAA
jgi:hypothetical protein